MYIKTLKIQNYKSFRESEDIAFERGFNLIVGQNDAGKTALLEALRPGTDSRPHRSIPTAPEIDSPIAPHSVTVKRFALSSNDVRTYLRRSQHLGLLGESPAAALSYFDTVLNGGCELIATWHDRGLVAFEMAIPSLLDKNGPYVYQNVGWPLDVIVPSSNGLIGGQPFYFDLIQQLCADIYSFGAERFNVGASSASGNRVLHSNASNLPEVLNKLTENPAVYSELLGHIKTIFPHITHVTAAIEGGNTAHIRIWTHPIESKRYDLAVPLADSGSGIGQVLAMLYVAVTAERPKIILIDEPQSFLHPGAIRKLFEILSEYSKHQYVITTHAPSGLNLIGATNMLMVRRGQDQSTVTQLNPSTQKDVSLFLAEIGVRLGDVFGADSVLWVEGKTEEQCFPILVRDIAQKMLGGTQILGLINTGDLEAGFAERAVEIYQRISVGPSIMPPAVAFILDSEGKTQSKRDDISRRAKGLIKWLPRRMYENYLLESLAICKLINREDVQREKELVIGDIDGWLSTNGGAQEYFPDGAEKVAFASDAWIGTVHAGKILKNLFGELTEERVPYEKVRHGEALTRLIAENPSDGIKALAEFVAGLCQRQGITQ